MKIAVALLTFLSFSTVAFSQDTPDDLIKRFFNTFEKNTDQALDEIYATNVWTSNMKDALTGMKKTIRNYPDEMGKYYGYDLINRVKCTERFVLYTYMARYDRQPMEVVFQFYKPNDKWILFSLNFSPNLDDNVEAAAKTYLPQATGKN